MILDFSFLAESNLDIAHNNGHRPEYPQGIEFELGGCSPYTTQIATFRTITVIDRKIHSVLNATRVGNSFFMEAQISAAEVMSVRM